MVDQEAAEKQAAIELVAAIKAISVRQAEIAGLLRDMIQIALPALHAEQRDMRDAMEQFRQQMVQLTAMIEGRAGGNFRPN
jgi:hypothetical protein